MSSCPDSPKHAAQLSSFVDRRRTALSQNTVCRTCAVARARPTGRMSMGRGCTRRKQVRHASKRTLRDQYLTSPWMTRGALVTVGSMPRYTSELLLLGFLRPAAVGS